MESIHLCKDSVTITTGASVLLGISFSPGPKRVLAQLRADLVRHRHQGVVHLGLVALGESHSLLLDVFDATRQSELSPGVERRAFERQGESAAADGRSSLDVPARRRSPSRLRVARTKRAMSCLTLAAIRESIGSTSTRGLTKGPPP